MMARAQPRYRPWMGADHRRNGQQLPHVLDLYAFAAFAARFKISGDSGRAWELPIATVAALRCTLA